MKNRIARQSACRVSQLMPDLLERGARRLIIQHEPRIVLDHPQRLAGAVQVGVEDAKNSGVHVRARIKILQKLQKNASRKRSFRNMLAE
jgi:hypothetical protein